MQIKLHMVKALLGLIHTVRFQECTWNCMELIKFNHKRGNMPLLLIYKVNVFPYNIVEFSLYIRLQNVLYILVRYVCVCYHVDLHSVVLF